MKWLWEWLKAGWSCWTRWRWRYFVREGHRLRALFCLLMFSLRIYINTTGILVIFWISMSLHFHIFCDWLSAEQCSILTTLFAFVASCSYNDFLLHFCWLFGHENPFSFFLRFAEVLFCWCSSHKSCRNFKRKWGLQWYSWRWNCSQWP